MTIGVVDLTRDGRKNLSCLHRCNRLGDMEIETIDGQKWSDLSNAARAGTTHLLLVVPHSFASCGIAYVMWGPRSDASQPQRITVASLPEIRAVDLSLFRTWESEVYEFPGVDGFQGPEQVVAETLLADEAFWAPATQEQAALRLAVRGLLPIARAARAAQGAIGVALDRDDSEPSGTLGSQN